jgi:hypothetical protein
LVAFATNFVANSNDLELQWCGRQDPNRVLALQRITGELKLLIHKKVRWVGIGAFIGALAFAATPVQAPQPTAGEAIKIKVALRRITETQYRHTIADVFGPSIKINARFEPEKRVDRLLAIGSAQL